MKLLKKKGLMELVSSSKILFVLTVLTLLVVSGCNTGQSTQVDDAICADMLENIRNANIHSIDSQQAHAIAENAYAKGEISKNKLDEAKVRMEHAKVVLDDAVKKLRALIKSGACDPKYENYIVAEIGEDESLPGISPGTDLDFQTNAEIADLQQEISNLNHELVKYNTKLQEIETLAIEWKQSGNDEHADQLASVLFAQAPGGFVPSDVSFGFWDWVYDKVWGEDRETIADGCCMGFENLQTGGERVYPYSGCAAFNQVDCNTQSACKWVTGASCT